MITPIFELCINQNPKYINAKSKAGEAYWHIMHKSYTLLKYAKFRMMDPNDYPVFFSAQRNYHILARFIQRCKIRKLYTRYNNDCDLTMTPLVDLPEHKKIEILENRCIYTFNLYDLVKIIYSALTIQSFGFSIPKMPANPYTNIVFRLETLYSIYARLGDKKIPPLLGYFLQCDFSIKRLKLCHKKHLMRCAIDNSMTLDYVNNVREMCCGYFKIHRDFPAARLYTIFRPYLTRYYRWHILALVQSRDELNTALRSFTLYNPHFGTKGEGGFDDRHLSFTEFLYGPISKILACPAMYELAMTNKRNYDSTFCVGLAPIFVEEDDDEDEDEDDDNNEVEDDDDESGSDGESDLASYGFD